MVDNIFITLLIFSPAIFFGIIGPIIQYRRHKKNIALNNQINNAIIDLYEQGYISYQRIDFVDTIQQTSKGIPPHPLHSNILLHGFCKRTSITAKEFHENLYTSRKDIVSSIIPNEKYDAVTKPNDRIAASKLRDSGYSALPLLFIGDGTGSTSHSGNPYYSDSSDYVGGSDFGGDGDGGDGGGGDGGGD